MIAAAAVGVLALLAGRRVLTAACVSKIRQSRPTLAEELFRARRQIANLLAEDGVDCSTQFKYITSIFKLANDVLAQDSALHLTNVTAAVDILVLLSLRSLGLQAAIVEAGLVPQLLRLLARHQDPPPSAGSCRTVRHRPRPCGHSGRGSAHVQQGAVLGQQGGGCSCMKAHDEEHGDTQLTVNVLHALVNLTSPRGTTTNPVAQALLSNGPALRALAQLLVPSPASSSMLTPPAPEYPAPPDSTATPAAAASIPVPRSAVQCVVQWQLAGLAARLAVNLCKSTRGQQWPWQQPQKQQPRRREGDEPPKGHGGTGQGSAESGGLTGACWVEADSEGGARRGSEGAGDLFAALVRLMEQGTAVLAEAAPSHGPHLHCGSGEVMAGPQASTAGCKDATRGGGEKAAAWCTEKENSSARGSCNGGCSGTEAGAVLPYALTAAKYGLAALVNATLDCPYNRWAVAEAGGLEALAALQGQLLSRRLWGPSRAGAAVQEAPYVGQQQQQQQQHHHHHHQLMDDDPTSELLLDMEVLSMRLVAYMCAAGSDLQSRLLQSRYGLVHNLLSFLLHPRLPHPLASSTATDTASTPAAAAGTRSAEPASHSGYTGSRTASSVRAGLEPYTTRKLAVQQFAAMALVHLTRGVHGARPVVAAAMDWEAVVSLLAWLTAHVCQATKQACEAASSTPRSAVLVPQSPSSSSTVGSTSCTIRNISSSSYTTTSRTTSSTTSCTTTSCTTIRTISSTSTDDGCCCCSRGVSELLLYTVWLLHQLSKSPLAAAVIDPRVIPELLAVLRYGNGGALSSHLRLRAVAAVGALCSAPATAVHRAAFMAAGGVRQLLAALDGEVDEHVQAHGMMCLASVVAGGCGDGGGGAAHALAEAVGGGALTLLLRLLCSPTEHACVAIAAAEAVKSLASTATILVSTQVADVPRLAEGGPHSSGSSSRSSGWEGGGAPPQEAACRGTAGSDEGARAVAAAVAAAADYVPQALLSRLVYLMLSSEVPQVRAGAQEALLSLLDLPGVTQRFGSALASTLQLLARCPELELRVEFAN